MEKIQIVLWVLLFLALPLVNAQTFNEGEVVLRTNYTIKINGWTPVNETKTFFNITLRTEDQTYNWNDLSNTTSIDEFHEILMVRTLNCNATTFQAKFDTCFDMMEHYNDSLNFITQEAVKYAEGWARQDEKYQRCNSKEANLSNVEEERDTCLSGKTTIEAERTRLQTDISDVKKDLNNTKNQRWLFAVGGGILVGGFFWYNNRKPKYKPEYERETGRTIPEIRDIKWRDKAK